MADDKNIRVEITAEDKASGQIKQVGEAFSETGDKAKKASEELGKVSEASKKTQDANESMASSVFRGVASWDILKEGIAKTTEFVKESVSAYLEQRKTLDLVKATVESTGASFSAVGPKIKEFGDKLEAMGFDSDTVQLSVAKLAKSAGGDFVKGMELAKLAADLTASGIGTLESNTDNLQKILVGKGQRALIEYKLNLSETATTAEILNAIQAKVTQTTEQYAQTIPGKIAIVNEAYNNLKKEVGSGFVLAVNDAIGSSDKLSYSMGIMSSVAEGLKIVVYEAIQILSFFPKVFLVIGESVWSVIDDFKAFGHAILSAGEYIVGWKDKLTGNTKEAEEHFRKASLEMTKSSAIFESGAKNAGQAIDDLSKTISNILNPTKSFEAAQKSATVSTAKLGETAKDVGEGIENANKRAEGSYVSLRDKINRLKDAYSDLLDKASDELSRLSEEHEKNLSSINKSIEETQRKIRDLTESYNQDYADDTRRVAEEIVASENRIAELKKRLAEETSGEQKKKIQEELDAEIKNYDSSEEFRKAHKAEIEAAEARAKKTELERLIDDYNQRRALALNEFNQKMSDLQAELREQRRQKNEINALYKKQADEIGKIVIDSTNLFIKQSQIRVNQTKDEVDEEVKLFNKLAEAISRVKTAARGAGVSLSSSTSGKATGGAVLANEAVVVGEQGPELFIPNSSGQIVANNRLGDYAQGGGITLVITGNTFMGKEDVAEEISQKIIDNLKLRMNI